MNSSCRCCCMQRPITEPSSTLSAANNVVVPWRLIIVRHGAAASLLHAADPGCVRSSAWIWLFSSIERTTACAGGSTYRPTMSVILAANSGSCDRLKVRTRCGWSSCACQIRCTDRREMPAALAIARPVQCVASCGGSVQVNATTLATVSAAMRRLAGLARFVAQKAVRAGFREALLPAPDHRAADAEQSLPGVAPDRPPPPQAPSGPDRHVSADGCDRRAIASRRSLSDALTTTHTVCAMRAESHGVEPL